MNTHEQLILKDFGRQFRSQVKKSIKHFTQVMNPLIGTLKDTITDLFKNFVTVDQPLQQQLVESCFYRYAARFEDQNYRFVLSTLEYMFSGQQNQLEFKAEINYKYLTVIYIEQLKGYFQGKQRKSLSNLYQKLNDLKQEKEADEGQEGFLDAMFDEQDSTPKHKKVKSQLGQTNFVEEGDISILYTKKEMAAKDEIIQSQNAKIRQREQTLIDITAGYLKDIQHLREQLFRKEYNLAEDSYSVSYININEIFDPRYRELVNIHLEDLKIQYEKKTQDLYRTIETQKSDISDLKSLVQSLQNLTKTMDSPQDMIQKAFRLETNPYKMWKILQELKGNFYFKEVFENQRPIYGINYREINQLMMTSKAYEREFLAYKQQVHDQQYVFYAKTLKEIEGYKLTLSERDSDICELNLSLKLQIQQSFNSAIDIVEDKKQIQIDLFKLQQNEIISSFKEEIQQIEYASIRRVIHTWAMINRILKLKSQDMDAIQIKNEVKLLIIDSNIYKEVTKELRQQLRFQTQINQILKDQNQSFLYKNIEMMRNQQLYNDNYEGMQSQIRDMKKRMNLQEQLKRQADTKRDLIQNNCSQIIGIIDPRMAHVQIIKHNQFRIEELKLNDKSSDLVQDFLKRLQNTDIQQLRLIKEISDQGQNNNVAFNALVERKSYLSVLTQTVIQDVSLPLDFISNNKMIDNDSTMNLQLDSQISEVELQKQQSQPQLDEGNESEELIFDKNGVLMQNKRLQVDLIGPELLALKTKEKELLNENRKQLRTIEKQKTKISSQQTPKGPGNNGNNVFGKDIKEQPFRLSIIKGPIEQKDPDHRKSYSLQPQIEVRKRVSKSSDKDKQKSMGMIDNTVNNMTDEKPYEKPKNFASSIQRVDVDKLASMNRNMINSTHCVMNKTSLMLQKKQQKVYERLFNDNAQKAERIRDLKHNLQLLERSHWEDVLVIFNKYQDNKMEYIEDVERDNQLVNYQIQDVDIKSFKSSTPYITQSNQKYYEKSKKLDTTFRIGQEGVYSNWFGKQHVQIEKMFHNLDYVTKKEKEQVIRAPSPPPRNTQTARTNYSKLFREQNESRQTSQTHKPDILNLTQNQFLHTTQNHSLLNNSLLVQPQLIRDQKKRKGLFKIK